MAVTRDCKYLKTLAREIGDAISKASGSSKRSEWYSPHMAAASCAIAERIPLVDFVLEVRDARIPLSSEFHLLRNSPISSQWITVMNKMDLGNRSQLKEWSSYFEQRNWISYGVNSHNKDDVKKFLNFLQTQVRELKKTGHSGSTITVMIVGIPNVGKSALANSLHQIGRISAAEKGKLRHAIVSPHPGETKDISSLKIGSHPNIYVLDTPGVLPPELVDIEICSRLALTGAIGHPLIEEEKLGQYFLGILNLADEYKKWEKFSIKNGRSFEDKQVELSSGSMLDMKSRKQYRTDHTQDCIVRDVRRSLFEAISCFSGDLENEKDMGRLIEVQFKALVEAFQVCSDVSESRSKIAAKLLNLYRTGRLGHYTLDHPPTRLNCTA